jgi:hypothetical protein
MFAYDHENPRVIESHACSYTDTIGLEASYGTAGTKLDARSPHWEGDDEGVKVGWRTSWMDAVEPAPHEIFDPSQFVWDQVPCVEMDVTFQFPYGDVEG